MSNPYRTQPPEDELPRLRRRVRALERAWRLSSPIRALGRLEWGAAGAAVFHLIPPLILVGCFAGLVWAVAYAVQVSTACDRACSREGMVLRHAEADSCECEPAPDGVKVVPP